MNTPIEIGSFRLSGTEMRVSDPSYRKGTWCAGTIKDCIPGKWFAAVVRKNEGDWGERIARLIVRHETAPEFNLSMKDITVIESEIHYSENWENSGIEVGVDSGQCGFFDETVYDTDEAVRGMEAPISNYGNDFYNHCCDLTLGVASAGIIPTGAVSCSGCGDGCYPAFIHRRLDGKADMAVLIFLED